MFGKTSLRAKNFKAQTLVSTASIAFLVTAGSNAWAQGESDTVTIERDTIIVTAQKREERIEDVPISISAVTADVIEKQSLTEIMFLQQVVPALRITRSGTFVQPTIRGIGSQVALPGLPQNIATYVDGYYVPTPGVSNFNLVNSAGVNVLKGPQGTLFGYNTTGGAIQVTTRDPEHEPSGFARIGYGRFNHVSGAFYGTAGVSDTLAVNLAASIERGDGYVTNIFTGDDKYGEFYQYYVRSKILWEPTDGISFKLGLAHSDEDDPRTQNVIARDMITNAIAVPGALIPTEPRVVAHEGGVREGYARFESSSITLTSEFDLGWATLTSYTGFRRDRVDQALDYDASSAPLNFSNWSVPDRTFTQEINITSPGAGRLDWVVGAFYLNTKDDYDFNVNFGDIFESSNKTTSIAVFADATYEVVDNLFLTFGARHTWDKPQVDFDLQAASFADSGEAKFDDLILRGVVRFEPTPDSSIYASYSQGYKAGALPASAFSTVPILPETIDAYEVGYKISSGPVRANVAAFFYDYSDIQVTTYGAGGMSSTVNAAKAESYGVDGDISWLVTPDLELTLSAAYTHGEYIDFPNSSIAVIDRDPMSATFGVITRVPTDASGARLERTPRFSGNVMLNYGFDMFGGRGEFTGNVFYSGKYNFDTLGQLPQDEHALVNLRLTWIDPSEKYEVSAFGTNVTGTEYFRSSFIDPFAARTVYAEPAEWGVSVTAHF